MEKALASDPQLAAKVAFNLVQIDEAHASDKWPLAYTFETTSATTMDQKHAHAVALRDEFEWTRGTVFVDCWDGVTSTANSATSGSFQKVFTAWPELYAVFYKGALSYVGQGSVESQGAYDIADLLAHLKRLC